MPHSALVVPVPELGPRVSHAHVVLLSPFAAKEDLTDGLLGELERFFADCVPWSFQLAEVAVLPSGTAYLAPEPAAAFRSLVHELGRRFPEYPSGTFDVPRLQVPDGFTLPAPLTAHAASAALWWYEDDVPVTLVSFPFGIAAA